MLTALIVVLCIKIYLAQMFICSLIHIINNTRIPAGLVDFLKLTFLPYVVYCLWANKDKLN